MCCMGAGNIVYLDGCPYCEGFDSILSKEGGIFGDIDVTSKMQFTASTYYLTKVSYTWHPRYLAVNKNKQINGKGYWPVIFYIFSYELIQRIDNVPETYGIFSHIFLTRMWLFHFLGRFLHLKVWMCMWRHLTEMSFLFLRNIDRYK